MLQLSLMTHNPAGMIPSLAEMIKTMAGIFCRRKPESNLVIWSQSLTQ